MGSDKGRPSVFEDVGGFVDFLAGNARSTSSGVSPSVHKQSWSEIVLGGGFNSKNQGIWVVLRMAQSAH